MQIVCSRWSAVQSAARASFVARLVRHVLRGGLFVGLALLVCLAPALAEGGAGTGPLVTQFLKDLKPGDLVPGADAFGALRRDVPVVPALKAGEVVGWVFLTSDFVSTTGYSGKPIHVVAGVDEDAVITGVRLVKHSEPIVLIGIPDKRIRQVTEKYAGLDLKREAAAGKAAHDLDIVSGATVTIIVIDDSIVRAGLKVAHALGLGGLSPTKPAGQARRRLDLEAKVAGGDWLTLAGDGSVRRMLLDVGQVNEVFAKSGDPRAAARPEAGDPGETFIDLNVALVSVPAIGRALLGAAEYDNLAAWLKPGEHAILVAGRGRYSFKGSGYVRGGIFDRIQLIQADRSVRFHDRQHRRVGALAAPGAPSFRELDLFRVPADSGFDPAEPFRLQLLVQRPVGPIDKAFTTFDLTYQTPERYLAPAAAQPSMASDAGRLTAPEAGDQSHIWKRIWADSTVEIGILVVALVVLTLAFFFQMWLTRHELPTFWFRIAFLTFTLVWLGWYSNAQLSVVNVMAFFSALTTDFSWDAFLMDPLVFILWFSVAASLLFWGRGAFCGWLCPFGALQELTNKVARYFRVPQIELPWGLHERLWPVKYMIFLGLFGLSLYSLELAEHYAEVEPFKTAIILKFQREWIFVVFAAGLLVVGLFVERFYCRYLCPLGAALAIPARLRMFDWLKRYRECGSPCQRCAKECMVQSIHPEGNINPNECLQCLHCQVLYQHDQKCPVCVAKLAKRRRFEKVSGIVRHEAPPARPSPVVAGLIHVHTRIEGGKSDA